MPVDETKPFLVFMKPPPGVRAHSPNTPQAGHLAAHAELDITSALRVEGIRLLDYGNDRYAGQDAYHWTGYWRSADEALRALRKLQALNAPRIALWKRIRLVKAAKTAAEATGGPLAGLLAEQLAAAAVAAFGKVTAAQAAPQIEQQKLQRKKQ